MPWNLIASAIKRVTRGSFPGRHASIKSKTQRAARRKRAGGDNKPMLKFLGGRNMVISLWYCLLADVHRGGVVGRSRTVANRTAFAKPRIGVDVGVCHARNVEMRSEEHTSELQSLRHLVCRLLLEKKTQ